MSAAAIRAHEHRRRRVRKEAPKGDDGDIAGVSAAAQVCTAVLRLEVRPLDSPPAPECAPRNTLAGGLVLERPRAAPSAADHAHVPAPQAGDERDVEKKQRETDDEHDVQRRRVPLVGGRRAALAGTTPPCASRRAARAARRVKLLGCRLFRTWHLAVKCHVHAARGAVWRRGICAHRNWRQ
eukprot:1661958-Prymnesium_polylepis.2